MPHFENEIFWGQTLLFMLFSNSKFFTLPPFFKRPRLDDTLRKFCNFFPTKYFFSIILWRLFLGMVFTLFIFSLIFFLTFKKFELKCKDFQRRQAVWICTIYCQKYLWIPWRVFFFLKSLYGAVNYKRVQYNCHLENALFWRSFINRKENEKWICVKKCERYILTL